MSVEPELISIVKVVVYQVFRLRHHQRLILTNTMLITIGYNYYFRWSGGARHPQKNLVVLEPQPLGLKRGTTSQLNPNLAPSNSAVVPPPHMNTTTVIGIITVTCFVFQKCQSILQKIFDPTNIARFHGMRMRENIAGVTNCQCV